MHTNAGWVFDFVHNLWFCNFENLQKERTSGPGIKINRLNNCQRTGKELVVFQKLNWLGFGFCRLVVLYRFQLFDILRTVVMYVKNCLWQGLWVLFGYLHRVPIFDWCVVRWGWRTNMICFKIHWTTSSNPINYSTLNSEHTGQDLCTQLRN